MAPITHAERAERITLAILDGSIPADRVDDALDDLRLANRLAARDRHVAAVAAFRRGEHLWVVPATAPWAGF